jgi:hypothetical protein
MKRNLFADMRSLSFPCLAGCGAPVVEITRILVLAALFASVATLASAQANPGDPLFCQPQEGVQFLIVNGGAGVFTADGDCYGNVPANDTALTIATGQGGSLHGTVAGFEINYIYTPPTANFTGLDTFSIPVTTVWNGAGGVGSAGGTAFPGGPATLNITLNVIPATTTLAVPPGVATLVPVPPGSLTGCTVGGNPGLGPAPGALYGCIGRIVSAVAPTHGTLVVSGNTLRYTPTAGYQGPDTFQYRAQGVNADGPFALNSGNVLVQVSVGSSSVPVPTLGTWGMGLLMGSLLMIGMKAAARRTA